jgi:hypothetical protein
MNGLALGGAVLRAKSIFAAVPSFVWISLAGAVAAISAVLWHNHAVNAAYNRGKADYAKQIEAKAEAIKAATDQLTTNISTLIRDTNDVENRRIASDANSILLRGPGRASCPVIPAAAGRSQPASGPAGAPISKLPYPKWDDLLAVRFPPAVAFAEQHDLNRAEVLSWRSWYDQESKAFKPPKKKRKLWPF